MKPPRQESTHNKSEMSRDKKGKKNNRASMVPAFTRKRNKEIYRSKTEGDIGENVHTGTKIPIIDIDIKDRNQFYNTTPPYKTLAAVRKLLIK